MNRKQFLKRLGLLSTTAIAAPAILADNLQSQPATTKITTDSTSDTANIKIKPGGQERMRIGSNGDSYYYIIY
jgi:hypothetical protein